jgi:hypothetical protein
MGHSARHANRSTLRRAVRLAVWRLAASFAFKSAAALCICASVWFTACVIFLGVKGHRDEVASVVSTAAIVIGWLAGGIVGLWAASDRNKADCADGVLAMAQCHGISPDRLRIGRAAGAFVSLSCLVFLCTAPVCIASIACASGLKPALARGAALLVVGAFSCGVGLTGGVLGSACGAIAPRRGRTVLCALVLMPWAFDAVLPSARSAVGSLPGLLGFVAKLIHEFGATG